MTDRQPQHPGRVLITPEDGSAPYYATITLADEPLADGTPLNKATLLTDATAALMNLGSAATPDDMLKALASGLVNKITYGTEELTPGVSQLATGTLYVVYQA